MLGSDAADRRIYTPSLATALFYTSASSKSSSSTDIIKLLLQYNK